MYRDNLLIILFLILTTLPFQAQSDGLIDKARSQLKHRGEIYFCFVLQKSHSIENMSDFLSIARLSNDTVFAYTNKEQFEKFLQLKIPFVLLVPPSLLYTPRPGLKNTDTDQWKTYPAYRQYLELMESYTRDFPELCNLIEIGESVGGKKILAVKISDNVNMDESEPEVLYTSTIHGDEPSGFIIMLRFIDYILNNYGKESRITRLLNNTEVFINPLANPDGLYFMSDTTVWGARRFNLNNVDLNRDFPDAEAGAKEIMQPETRSMIDFLSQRRIILSANFHEGAEVVNYPWDVWSRKHADDAWYISLSRQYADTAQKYSIPGYMDDLNNGITNGYEWYTISGGRQDYVNYYLHGREVTIELSLKRFPEGEALDDLWEYNKSALVSYLINSHDGIRGTVTDSLTGKPLEARIFVNDHDRDNSFVFSDRITGTYYRMINSGNYRLTADAEGYHSKELTVSVPDTGRIMVNVALKPLNAEITVYPNPFSTKLKIQVNDTVSGAVIVEMYDVSGKKIINRQYESAFPDLIEMDAGFLSTGFYLLKVRCDAFERQVKIIKIPEIP